MRPNMATVTKTGRISGISLRFIDLDQIIKPAEYVQYRHAGAGQRDL